jgi:hypothetical protein
MSQAEEAIADTVVADFVITDFVNESSSLIPS